MKAANTVEMAKVEVPNTSCSSRTHSTWYVSDVAPDKKKRRRIKRNSILPRKRV